MNSVNKTNFAKTVKAASQNNRRAARLIIEAYERGTTILLTMPQRVGLLGF